MSAINLFFLRTLLLLWVICVVLCERGHSRRDANHIIFRDQPRGHKRPHYSHDRSHRGRDGFSHQRHSGRDKRGHKSRGKKLKFSSEEDGSFEEADASFGRENSYEEKFRSQKAHKSHRQSKTPRRKPSHSSNDSETYKHEPYRDNSGPHYYSDWMPLSSEQLLRFSSFEENRNKRRKRTDGKQRKDSIPALKPPPVEITTSYPFQFDPSANYPQLGSFSSPFSNWNLNQKIFQSNSPLIGTIEQPNMQVENNSDRLKNHRTSYEEPEHSLNTFISVPEDSRLVNSKEEEESEPNLVRTPKTTTTTVKPTRSRGRGNHRGNKKQ